jgi:F0F1-type ATP synthase membrane subunit b/b'
MKVGDFMALTDAQRRAKNKYDAKTYELMQTKPTKEEAAIIRDHAKKRGESLTRFVVRAANNQIERDNETSESEG